MNGKTSYIARKIAHMKRLGLVAQNSSGTGRNGGACPDWLRKVQDDREEKFDAGFQSINMGGYGPEAFAE